MSSELDRTPATSVFRRPSRAVTMLYIKYCLIIDISFFSLYTTCNWLTSLRKDRLAMYFDWELSIPFVPVMIWGYVSMLVLFLFPLFTLDTARLHRLGKQILLALPLAISLFLLLPAELGFQRILPESKVRAMFEIIFLIDLPHNLMPSLHIIFSTLIILTLMEVSTWLLQIAYGVWLVIISMSVVLVHQHHLIDVVGGFLLAYVSRVIIDKSTILDPQQ